MSYLPKSYIIKLILEKADREDVRKYFSIKPDTPLKSRLSEYSIAKLMGYINRVGERLSTLVEVENENFPLKAAPTLYIISIGNPINVPTLGEQSKYLRIAARDKALILSEDRAIRAIYTRRELKKINEMPKVYELMLGYERRLEYTESDPDNPDYSKLKEIYSLENAFVWVPEENEKFAVVSCSDFCAISPIIKYLNKKFNLNANLPDLSQKMLERISEGSNIKSATFSNLSEQYDENDIDVKTITVFDGDLQDRRVFLSIKEQNNREQRAGFYSSHPDLLRAGIGITRRYGRVWTPAHLNRDELVRLALGIIAKLEIELDRASKEDISEVTGFYKNMKVKIGSTTLVGQERIAFDYLIRCLVTAEKNSNQLSEIDRRSFGLIVKNSKKLNLGVSLTYECGNCGVKSAVCPVCNIPFEVLYGNDEVIIQCPACNRRVEDRAIECECGESSVINDPYSQMFCYPSLELLKAIETYFSCLHPLLLEPKPFVIVGTNIVLLKLGHEKIAKRVALEELGLWRTRAKLHVHKVSSEEKVKGILGKMKEKCPINNYHPKQEDCKKCLKKLPNKAMLDSGKICLLRLFGIPIDSDFDGIHHRYEGADIKYCDCLNDEEVKIGIHVKSKSGSNRARGLGRTNFKIRELYTQLYYSLYEMQNGTEKFDILGIGIPNKISMEVEESMQSLLLKLGISFIIIDHDCWMKILSLGREKLLFEIE